MKSDTAQDGEERYRRMMRRRFRNLFKALEDLIVFVTSMLKAWKPPKGSLSLYQYTVVLLVARAHNAAAGVVVLAERGFGELAMSICRLLAEAMVSAHWMSVDPEERGERALRFRRFGELEGLELGELLKELGQVRDEDIPAKHKDPAYVGKLKKEFRDRGKGWMQQPMNTVIKHIEPMWGTPEKRKDFLGTMSILHLTGDRHSHIGASDTVQFHGDGGIALGPTDIAPRWVSQALKQAIVCYLELIDLAVKELKLMDVAAWNDVIDKATARASWLRREQVEGLHSDSPCPCGGGLPYGQCHEGVDLLPEELEPAK